MVHVGLLTCHASPQNFIVGWNPAHPTCTLQLHPSACPALQLHGTCVCCQSLPITIIPTRSTLRMSRKHMARSGHGRWVWLQWPTEWRCSWCLWAIPCQTIRSVLKIAFFPADSNIHVCMWDNYGSVQAIPIFSRTGDGFENSLPQTKCVDMYMYDCMYLQWNLSITDAIGTK